MLVRSGEHSLDFKVKAGTSTDYVSCVFFMLSSFEGGRSDLAMIPVDLSFNFRAE